MELNQTIRTKANAMTKVNSIKLEITPENEKIIQQLIAMLEWLKNENKKGM